MVSMKVYNDEVWNEYVKTGRVKGFSIEGYFADRLERPQDKQKDTLSEDEKIIKQLIDALEQDNGNTK
jgi:hypothetical protein